MEQEPQVGGQEGEHDYEHDPLYVRNLKAWNEAQLEIMFSHSYREEVAERLGKSAEEVGEQDIINDWVTVGSPRFREEHKNDPDYYRLRNAA